MDATPEQIDAMLAAPELPEVAVLRVQSGDTIVLRLKERLSDEQFDETVNRWATQVKDTFPDNHLAVIEGNADILVLRKDGA